MKEINETLCNVNSDTLNYQVATLNNLDIQSLMNLRQTNKKFYNLFKPAFFQHLKKYIERSAKKQVEILLNDMNLNFSYDHIRSAACSALKLGDIDLFKVIVKRREDMVIPINFPKKLVDETNTYDFNTIIAAIESNKDVENTLAKFKIELNRIVEEKGFPYQALLDAYKINGEKFYLWRVSQTYLFNLHVIGYLQRLSPAWLKKAFATGIANMTDGKACSDTFTLDSGESIDPSRELPNVGLGFNIWVNLWARTSSLGPMRGGWNMTQIHLENLFRKQTAELWDVSHHINQLTIAKAL